MPTYDYVCDACGHKFELFQLMKDDPKKKCEECGKPKLRRLFGTGAAIMFKGSGFYSTDYRSESYKKQAAADKPSESKPTESKPTESKPTESKPSESKSSESKPGKADSKSSKKNSKPAGDT